MGATGLELPPKTPGNATFRPPTGADSGARSDKTPPADAREPDPGTHPTRSAYTTPPVDTTPAPIPTLPPATPTDPDLAAVVRAWPDLPVPLRAGILAMVLATGRPAHP